VLATVSDRKWAIDTTGTPGIANYYEPNIINAQDYYPFGMPEPGRGYTRLGDSMYRFGFNGMMKDNDIYGTGNTYTTKNRELDDRLGRWWSTDPTVNAEQSPYVSMSDNPILNDDPLGDCDICDFGKGVASGIWDGVKGTASGLSDIVLHPINTAEGLGNAITHPSQTLNGIEDAVSTAYNKLTNGNAYDKGEVIGGLIEGIAENLVGVGEVGDAAKVGEVAKGLTKAEEVVTKTEEVASKSTKIEEAAGKTKVHGNSAKSTEQTGNYTNTHASGKTYSGVGNEKRMNQSAKRIATNHQDPVVKQEWTPAANKKEAYLKEHEAIERNGRAGNKAKNYNERNSPGKKLSEQNK
jgi:hypothetical protein